MKPVRLFTTVCLLFALQTILAQETTQKKDTLKLQLPEQPSLKPDSLQLNAAPEQNSNAVFDYKLKPSLTAHSLGNSSDNTIENRVFDSPKVQINGYGHDLFNNSERTAVFSVNPANNLTLYSAATIGVYKTLPFGNINYYNLNLGTAFAISRELTGNGGVFYQSTLKAPLPIAGTYANFAYRPSGIFQIDGGLTYQQTLGNRFNVYQKSLMLDAHARYRLAEDWYINAYGGMPLYQSNNLIGAPMLPMMPRSYYGGTLEYWFQPKMAVEGGIIMQQDMFGKMHPVPKLEFKFGDR
ncbi:MAG: hypothetical protein PHO94_07405 [Petrimonas sp.]|nr:hypothetical protein [Petrimonas sp.]